MAADARITVRLDAETAEDLLLLVDTYGGRSAAVRHAVRSLALRLSRQYIAADRERTGRRTEADTPGGQADTRVGMATP